MTNEIKEILEALKSHNDIVKEYPLTLSIEEQKILLDYITDLQKENEKLKWERNSYYEDIICYIRNTMHVSDKKARKTFDKVSMEWSTSTIYLTLCELEIILRGDE